MGRPIRQISIERLRALHRAGRADGEIALVLECSRDIVLDRRRRLGLKANGQAGRPYKFAAAQRYKENLDREWAKLSSDEKARLLAYRRIVLRYERLGLPAPYRDGAGPALDGAA
jgi:hypothetical protein